MNRTLTNTEDRLAPSGSAARRWLGLAVLLLSLCAAAPAMAACNFVGASFSAGTFNFGTIALNKRYAPGEVIATKQLPYDSVAAHTAFFCGAAVSTTATFLMSGTGGAGNIFPTNLGGIGIRISVWSNQAYLTAPTAPTLAPTDWTFTLSSGGAFGSGYLQVKAELVAISDSQYAGAMSYQVPNWFVAQAGASSLRLSSVNVIGTVVDRTCSVVQGAVAVALPNVVASTLAVGGTGGSTPFSLDLNCPAGTKVAVTLTDATTPSNRTTTLSLASSSTAAGVGLRVFNGATPIAYGPDSNAAGNTNQWSAGTAAGGAMSIPLSASYVRTSATLTPGTVKGAATFTMSYQ